MEKKRTRQSPLEKLGIVDDLGKLLHLPFRYEDETRLYLLKEAVAIPAAVTLDFKILGSQVRYGAKTQLIAKVADAAGDTAEIRFFNLYPSQMSAFNRNNAILRVFGEVRQGLFGFEMMHPRYHFVQAGTPAKTTLTPIYPTTTGLPQYSIQSQIAFAIKNKENDALLAEVLPDTFLKEQGLPSFADAIRLLHAPPANADRTALENHTHPAWQRVKLDELLAQQISLQRAMAARKSEKSRPFLKESRLQKALIQNLPFVLTNAQQRVVAEIAEDLSKPFPMHRLLQGDVGSGKTIVAAFAVCQAIDSGFQAALMVPTEILAEQHAKKFKEWLMPLGIPVTLLIGTQTAKVRRAALKEAQNATGLVIGTHALIQEKAIFANLGLVIIDEQHRFGVGQRLALREKGDFPHQLMMSATPIPRTLAMSYYADLDVSTIDELPKGRKPIQTRLIKMSRRDELIQFIGAQAAQNRQIYWVCPLVEESEKLELQAAIQTETQLKEKLPHCTIALVHGRQKPAEKAAVMADFINNRVQILVATTVIEVGVDVPNASLMVIEDAERFGLTQLHQLRGRVGRGAAESICVLLYSEDLSELAKARLKVIFENTDGFAIANADLELRGPGELVGQKQSGVVIFRYANLMDDAALLDFARPLATDLLKTPAAADIILARWHGKEMDFLKA